MGGATSKFDETDWNLANGKLETLADTIDGAPPTTEYEVYQIMKRGVNQRDFDVVDGKNNVLYTTRAVPGTLAYFDVLGPGTCGPYLDLRLRVQVDLSRRTWIVYRYQHPIFLGQLPSLSLSKKLFQPENNEESNKNNGKNKKLKGDNKNDKIKKESDKNNTKVNGKNVKEEDGQKNNSNEKNTKENGIHKEKEEESNENNENDNTENDNQDNNEKKKAKDDKKIDKDKDESNKENDDDDDDVEDDMDDEDQYYKLFKTACITVSWSRYIAIAVRYGPPPMTLWQAYEAPTANDVEAEAEKGEDDDFLSRASKIAASRRSMRSLSSTSSLHDAVSSTKQEESKNIQDNQSKSNVAIVEEKVHGIQVADKSNEKDFEIKSSSLVVEQGVSEQTISNDLVQEQQEILESTKSNIENSPNDTTSNNSEHDSKNDNGGPPSPEKLDTIATGPSKAPETTSEGDPPSPAKAAAATIMDTMSKCHSCANENVLESPPSSPLTEQQQEQAQTQQQQKPDSTSTNDTTNAQATRAETNSKQAATTKGSKIRRSSAAVKGFITQKSLSLASFFGTPAGLPDAPHTLVANANANATVDGSSSHGIGDEETVASTSSNKSTKSKTTAEIALEGVVQIDDYSDDKPIIQCQEIYTKIIGTHQTSYVSREQVLKMWQVDEEQHEKDEMDANGPQPKQSQNSNRDNLQKESKNEKNKQKQEQEDGLQPPSARNTPAKVNTPTRTTSWKNSRFFSKFKRQQVPANSEDSSTTTTSTSTTTATDVISTTPLTSSLSAPALNQLAAPTTAVDATITTTTKTTTTTTTKTVASSTTSAPVKTASESDSGPLTIEPMPSLLDDDETQEGDSDQHEQDQPSSAVEVEVEVDDEEKEQPLVGYWAWKNSILNHKMELHLAKNSDLALHVVLAILVNQVRYERNALAMTTGI